MALSLSWLQAMKTNLDQRKDYWALRYQACKVTNGDERVGLLICIILSTVSRDRNVCGISFTLWIVIKVSHVTGKKARCLPSTSRIYSTCGNGSSRCTSEFFVWNIQYVHKGLASLASKYLQWAVGIFGNFSNCTNDMQLNLTKTWMRMSQSKLWTAWTFESVSKTLLSSTFLW